MPTFIDFHGDLNLPQEAISQLAEDARDKKYDEFSVRQIELYHSRQGQVYCVLEAPDADAVRAHHAALDIACGDVVEVEQLPVTASASSS